MKKSYNSIRLVRVGKAGETQFERGSIEDTVRRISRGDNLKLDSLGQTLLSVLHTDLPPLPTKPVRRLSSKKSVPVKSGHWRPNQRPSAPGSSFQDLLSQITTRREKPQTKSGPVSEIEPASRRKEGTEASRERMMICFIKAELWNKFCSDQSKMFFWQEFLATRNDVRKLVYDGKAVLNCILAAIPAQINLPPTLRLIDPIIGCWLLKPDHPVHTFKMVLEMILPDLTVTNLGSVRPSDLAAQTEALASVCRTM